MKRFFLTAATVALVASLAGPALAFCRTTTVATDPSFSPTDGKCWDQGIFVYHSRKCVGYSIETPGSKKVDTAKVKELAEAAFRTWETSTCGSGKTPTIDAQFFSETSRTALGYDTTKGAKNASAIVFWDDKWPNSSKNEVILTTLTFNKETGEILDADMEVNTAEIDFSLEDPVPANGTDMASALAHEVGHFFGLAHSSNRQATMYAKYTPGSTFFRDLTQDDIDGLCSIYLADGQRQTSRGKVAAGTCDPSAPPPPSASTGEGGCSQSGPGASGNAATLLVPGLALALVWGIRRRRTAAESRI